jgi:hypothetical protein
VGEAGAVEFRPRYILGQCNRTSALKHTSLGPIPGSEGDSGLT